MSVKTDRFPSSDALVKEKLVSNIWTVSSPIYPMVIMLIISP